jgi:hypothetical protein
MTRDNAQDESFWATLKVEFYDRYLWPTRAAAKVAVGDWIERVYNRRRRHSAIAIISPSASKTGSTYLRLKFLKFRYPLGCESLCRDVTDSITWRRFCRIGLDGRCTRPR